MLFRSLPFSILGFIILRSRLGVWKVLLLPMITPAQIEKRLYELSKEIDEAHEALVQAESEYHRAVADYEIAMAKSRMSNSQPDLKMTAQMREDQALIENSNYHFVVALAEASVKAARANANRLKTQVDIARSISVSVRNEMSVEIGRAHV